MVSILKEIDITQVFNHFAQKKCINHLRRNASSVCLHQYCWNSEFDQACLCVDCNVDHIKNHGDSLRFDALLPMNYLMSSMIIRRFKRQKIM